ncbi:MAG: 2'-5' RNA ligase family protein [Actinomycetota bacterium]
MDGFESALVVEVPAAEPIIGRWRIGHDPVARRGVPAHVTVLYPFVPPDELSDAVFGDVAAAIAPVSRFGFELTTVDEFPGVVVWLRPDPEAPFRDLTERLHRAFPDHPPYGGRHLDAQPHLTVAMTDVGHHDAQRDVIKASIAGQLPVQCVADSVSLFVSDNSHTWIRKREFPLGDSTLD